MINSISQQPKILVVGDLIIDHYLWGSCERISPEAPVQVINIDNENSILGGAGNVINNLSSLSAKVDVISVIGSCDGSKILKNLLSDINVNTKYLITEKNRIVSKKNRIIATRQQVVRFDHESTEDISIGSQTKIKEIFNSIADRYDLILLSDYNKGVLTYELTQTLIKISNCKQKKILIDPKGSDYSKYYGSFLLTPNKKEASLATMIDIKDHKSLTEAMKKLKDENNLTYSVVTLSEDGVAIYDEELRIYPTVAREVFDVTGAGDTVLASLGYALSCGKNIDEAIKFANLASGVVVGKIGSATASLDEIIEYESNLNKSSSNNHIKTLKEITSIITNLKNKNKKIVFTNGCFDLLHSGHVKYLEEAKKFGDILIIGLNSDDSIKNIKGLNRPIISQDKRAYLLGSLEVVDYVVIFNEDSPLNLIREVQPDILVKGGDYAEKEVVGQNIAKELKIVQFFDGNSTSETIKKIQNL